MPLYLSDEIVGGEKHMAHVSVLLKTSDLTGMPVLLEENGKKVSQVSDVVLDPNKKSISALLLESDDLQTAKAIKFSDVVEIVSNTVFVKNNTMVKPVSQVIKMNGQNEATQQVVQNNVMTPTGEVLGRVTDLYFDPIKGKVEQVEYQMNRDGQTKRVRLKAEGVNFREDFVEVSTQNPLMNVIESVKEKIT